MHPALLVALGAAVGGVARWAVSGWIDARCGGTVPFWGTLVVNALGGLLIGLITAMQPRDELRLLLITGLLGGFTTFSAFSLQGLQLLQQGRVVIAAGYAVASVVACLLACWAGWALARLLSAPGS